MVRGQRFETLDGMRGLCALMVGVYHSAYALNLPQFPEHGWLSVDMFFVLSGFVIALTYEERLSSGMTFGGFLAARGRRLIPTQIIGTVMCVLSLIPLYFHLGWTFIAAALCGLLLVPITWTPISGFPAWLGSFPANPVLWSLQGEWLINFAYGAGLHKAKSWILSFLAFAAAVSIGALAFTTIGWATPSVAFLRAAIGFLAGVLIFRFYRAHKLWWAPNISPLAVYAIWFLATCAPFLSAYRLLDILPGCALSALLVTSLVCNERPMGPVWAYLGRISYPLYASHFAVINSLLWLWPSHERRSVFWVIPILAVQILLATGMEKVLRLKQRNAAYPEKQLSPV